MASGSVDVLGPPSNLDADTPHADPATNTEQSQPMCESRAEQVVETRAPTSNDTAVMENGPRPLAELCQDQMKEGEEVQASQLHDDLCSTLLNDSLTDPTLSDTTIHPGSSDSAKGSQPESSAAAKPPETDESSSHWVDVLGNGQLMKKVCLSTRAAVWPHHNAPRALFIKVVCFFSRLCSISRTLDHTYG